MKKILACSLAALGLAAPAQAAQNQFYIGADYVYSMNSVDKGNGPMFRNYNPEITYHTDYADDYSLPSINVGYNFSENFGIEAFYMTSGKEKDKYYGIWNSLDTLQAETSFQAYGVDMIGYIGSTDKVDWLLTAGVAQYEYETKYKYHYLKRITKQTVEDDGLGVRVGAGFQINLDRYISLRAMYRYVFTELDGMKHAQEILVGVRVGFYPFY